MPLLCCWKNDTRLLSLTGEWTWRKKTSRTGMEIATSKVTVSQFPVCTTFSRCIEVYKVQLRQIDHIRLTEGQIRTLEGFLQIWSLDSWSNNALSIHRPFPLNPWIKRDQPTSQRRM